MDNILNLATQYGALGLTVLACFWYINKKDEENKSERKDHEDIFKIMHEEALDVTRNNTIALTEMTTIIKTKL